MLSYDLINIVSVASIVVLNIFKSSITVPCILVYSVLDTMYILKNKTIHKPNRRVQLILHHLATISAVIASTHFKQYSYFGPRIINIDISTLLIMTSKLTRIQALYHISMIVWFYSRIVYFPLLVYEISQVVSYSVPLHVIMYLGFVWTLESLKVPKNFLRPCVFSLVASYVPIIFKTNNIFLLVHTILLILVGTLHHSFYGKWILFHKVSVYTYLIHVTTICYSSLFYWKYLLGVIAVYSECKKITDESRDWNNILDLFPHMCVHYLAAVGIYYSM